MSSLSLSSSIQIEIKYPDQSFYLNIFLYDEIYYLATNV